MGNYKPFSFGGCDMKKIMKFLDTHWIPIVLLWYTILLFMFAGCSVLQTQQPLQDNALYNLNDMEMQINGAACKGVCKVSKADSYTIKITTREEIDQIVISTCVRTDIPKPDDLGSRRKGYTYIYRPGLLEKDPGCNLSISGYIKDKGKSANGLIVFDNERYALSAGLSCNGSPDYGSVGTAICQAMQGQRMMIWFTRKVRLSARKIIKPQDVASETAEDRRCQINPSADGLTWKVTLASRECNYLFETIEQPYTQFLLYTVGAEKIPIRGD